MLKIVLLAALAIAVVAGIVVLAFVMNWPWWAGLAIGLGVVGIVLGAIVIKKWLFRKSEKNFVKRVTADDSASMASVSGADQRNLQLLDERWKEAIDALRRSQLKKHGQPLYVLPWYLIMGEAGSGKTAAIKGTRLHSALIDVSQSGGAGTKNCDWWFFEKVIVLDSTGRYTIPIDELQDKAEWHQFLMLLARYRKKEPINGVMVSVGADKLLASDPDVLADHGRLIRRRIDELMRAFGARFPVFIMVTKIDQIPGMGSFCELLPDEILDQAMGRSTQSASARPTKHVEDTITYVSERLKELRTLLLQKKPLEDPGALIFPDEIVKLKPTLSRFAETIFERNPYQEPPLLRGIYFCSARQESGARSLPGALAAFQSALDKGPPTFKGIFLKDFFRKILPEARNLIAPTSEFIRWRKMVRTLGLLAWLTVFLFLTGFLTLSFIKNVSTISTFRAGFSQSPKLANEITKDVLLLGLYRKKIIELQSLNEGWFIPRMGLDASLRMEEGLKKEYCDIVRKGLIDRLDQSIADTISAFSRNTPEETVVAYVDHIGNRISILSEMIAGEGLRDEEKIPPTLFSVLSGVDTNLMPDLAGKNILPVYLTYLRWNQNKQLLEQERTRLKEALKHLALGKGTDLFWLIKWANLQKIKPVRVGDFWTQQIQSETKEVPPAFTKEGWKQIQGFLKQYEEAVADDSIKDRKLAFENRYYSEYIRAWQQFAESFEPANIKIPDPDDRRQAAQVMTDTKNPNPYFKLLDRMNDELGFLKDNIPNPPEWVTQVLNYASVKKWADKPEGADKLEGALNTIKTGINKLRPKNEGDSVSQLEQIAEEADRYKIYRKTLEGLVPVTTSSESAMKMYTQLLTDSATSPIQTAFNAWSGYRRVFPNASKDNLYLKLLYGPLDFVLSFALQDVLNELQTKWEAIVVAEVQTVPERERRKFLLDPSSGVVWKFVLGPAAPFIGKGPQGYFPNTFLNQRFPFQKQFLDFINRRYIEGPEPKPEYVVKIEALPTTANKDATLQPFETVLVLECDRDKQSLDNLQYRVSKQFTWKPDVCGDVILSVYFKDNPKPLSKRYIGPSGFQQFGGEFSRGPRVFTASDFPENTSYLRHLNVREIKVQYAFDTLEFLRIVKNEPVRVPELIVVR